MQSAEDSVEIYTGSIYLRADKAVYNEDTHLVDFQGHVFFQNFEDGQKLSC